MRRLALLAALAAAPPLSAQTVTKVSLPDVTITLEQGAAPYLMVYARLRCDVWSGTAHTTKGCNWTSRNPALVKVGSTGRWTLIQPVRKNGETWVIASLSGQSDSVLVRSVVGQ